MSTSSNESIDQFCDTPLWDDALWTNTSFPRLTACFQQTALTYVPCGWLWLAGMIHLRIIIKNLYHGPLPFSVINILKTVLCLVLAILTVTQSLVSTPEKPSEPSSPSAAIPTIRSATTTPTTTTTTPVPSHTTAASTFSTATIPTTTMVTTISTTVNTTFSTINATTSTNNATTSTINATISTINVTTSPIDVTTSTINATAFTINATAITIKTTIGKMNTTNTPSKLSSGQAGHRTAQSVATPGQLSSGQTSHRTARSVATSGQLSSGQAGHPTAHYVAVSLKTCTFLYAALLTFVSRQALIASPCVLFIFWTLEFSASMAAFSSVAMDQTHASADPGFLQSCAIFTTVCLQLFLSCWGEASLRDFHYIRHPDPDQTSVSPNPVVSASFLSKITFHWMNSLIYRGFRRALTVSDVWDLPPSCRGQAVIFRFFRSVERQHCRQFACPSESSHANPKTRQTEANETAPLISSNAGSQATRSNGKQQTRSGASDDRSKIQRRKCEIPLLRCLMRTFYVELLFSTAVRLFGDCVQFLNPLLLDKLIKYVENREQQRPWQGYLVVIALFVVSFIVSICQNQGCFLASTLGVKVKTALVACVYRKTLTMPTASIRGQRHREGGSGHFNVDRVVSLLSEDCQSVQAGSAQLWVLLSTPVQIILVFCFVSAKLGLFGLLGVVILVAMATLNIRVSAAARRYQTRQQRLKDQRLELMKELLAAIREIKLNGWEEIFGRRVTDVRHMEVVCLRRRTLLTAVNEFVWICLPTLMTTTTLVTYSLVSVGGSLDASTAFVVLYLFNLLKQPLTDTPQCISQIVQSHVCLKRLKTFLSCEDLQPHDVHRHTETGVSISLKNATFTWGHHFPPCLCRLQLEVTEGQLVGVVGEMGAGKSSLLSALMGEMVKVKGTASLRGRVAYVPQEAWVQNRSLRDCVLLNKPLNDRLYRRVIRACGLKPDILALPAKDETEIGDQGMTLTRGQRLRVTLARAVYQDADVYLLDDPLSALDCHMARRVFTKIVGASGLLKTKTRILVTNSVHWLPMCDVIVVMTQGHVTQTGTYEQLLKHDGPFAQFLKTCLRHDTEHLDSETQKILSQMQVRVESITSDGMTSADEDPCQLRTKPTKPRVRGRDASLDCRGQVYKGQVMRKERSPTGQIKGYILKELLQAFGAGATMTSAILLVTCAALSVSADVILSLWTADAVLQNSSYSSNFSEFMSVTTGDIKRWTALYACLGVLQATLTFCFLAFFYVSMTTASSCLHDYLLSNVLHQPMSFFDTNHVAQILNRFSRDVDTLDGSLAPVVRMFAAQVCAAVSVALVISYCCPLFLAAVLPLVILVYLIQMYTIPSSRHLRQKESASRCSIHSHFRETIQGVTSIRAFGVTQHFQSESEKLVDRNNAFYFAFNSASRWLSIRAELLGTVVIVLTALLAVTSFQLTASLVGLSMSCALMAPSVLRDLLSSRDGFEDCMIAVDSILDYVRLPQESPWVVANRRPDTQWPSKGTVRFQRYSTRYIPGQDPVLKSVSCTLHSGQKVGVVGPSGSGKSALSLSLFRMMEATEGSIAIDGVNIATIGLHDLRSRLSIIPQEPVLFAGTLRFNLDPAGKCTDSELWAALENVHLGCFLPGRDRQAAGLDCPVEQGGVNLSLGQRLTVCLARAVLRKPRVVILHEATAEMDVSRDSPVHGSILTTAPFLAPCTLLTIAQRVESVMDCDRILVMKEGRIEEDDSPENLLADRSTLFYGMAHEGRLVP